MVGCFCRSGCVAEVAGLYFIERARGHFGELTRAGHGFLVDFFLFFHFSFWFISSSECYRSLIGMIDQIVLYDINLFLGYRRWCTVRSVKAVQAFIIVASTQDLAAHIPIF
jgi:hypothetical protein